MYFPFAFSCFKRNAKATRSPSSAPSTDRFTVQFGVPTALASSTDCGSVRSTQQPVSIRKSQLEPPPPQLSTRMSMSIYPTVDSIRRSFANFRAVDGCKSPVPSKSNLKSQVLSIDLGLQVERDIRHNDLTSDIPTIEIEGRHSYSDDPFAPPTPGLIAPSATPYGSPLIQSVLPSQWPNALMQALEVPTVTLPPLAVPRERVSCHQKLPSLDFEGFTHLSSANPPAEPSKISRPFSAQSSRTSIDSIDQISRPSSSCTAYRSSASRQ